jgi:hypothetical protein
MATVSSTSFAMPPFCAINGEMYNFKSIYEMILSQQGYRALEYYLNIFENEELT